MESKWRERQTRVGPFPRSPIPGFLCIPPPPHLPVGSPPVWASAVFREGPCPRHSPVVVLPSLVPKQQIAKPVPGRQRGHLALQIDHPSCRSGARRGRRSGGRQEGEGAGQREGAPGRRWPGGWGAGVGGRGAAGGRGLEVGGRVRLEPEAQAAGGWLPSAPV